MLIIKFGLFGFSFLLPYINDLRIPARGREGNVNNTQAKQRGEYLEGG